MANNQQKIDAFFNRFAQKVQQAQQRIPQLVGTEVVNSAINNFQTESYFGQKWPARQNKKNQKKLLVKNGFLWRSIRVIKTTPTTVTIGSDLPYARIHNEGGKIARKARQAVITHKRYTKGIKKGKTLFAKNNERANFSQKATIGAYTINMKQRQFLGAHPKLKAHLLKVVETELKTALK